MAVALKDRGVRPVVIDQADEVAASWRRRYDRLQLNTWRVFSHLPDRPYPKGTPTFPTRDQVVAHIEEHACEDGIDLRLGTRVERIDSNHGGWTVHTDAGELRAAQVVRPARRPSCRCSVRAPGRPDSPRLRPVPRVG